MNRKVINEWVEMCETEQVLRKASTNFQWDVRPGASDPTIFGYKVNSIYMNMLFTLYTNMVGS